MSAHAQHAMHAHSRLAHNVVRQSLPARQAEVYGAVLTLGRGTDRQIATLLGYSDLNRVRPRITELLQEGALIEHHATRCKVTRRLVRTVTTP